MHNKMSTKEWPDVLGLTWQEAEKRIRGDYPNITVQVLPEGSTCKADTNTDRVRVFVNSEGTVTKVPNIG